MKTAFIHWARALIFQRQTTLFVLFSFFSFTLQAQKEANIWYFGFNAGIDFNSGSPVALTDGQIRTLEGCASVANANGNLLFYTDGSIVYNKKHNIMFNGSGLFGNNSSSQSAVVVPLPGSSTKYYIFTVDAISGPNGLCYSIVDMSLQGGDGAVITKNTQILSPASEKITVTQHRNKKDFWIISHKFNTNQMHAFLLTSTGLNSSSVISSIGGVIGGLVGNSQGYLKVSPDGSRLAMACDFCGFISIMNFDNSVGSINSLIQLNYSRPYGVEFSPNNRYLYVSGWGNNGYIVQLDLKNYLPGPIKSSEVILASGTVPYSFCALQLAVDGKIYIATNNNYLNSIDNPNNGGNACNYRIKSVDLLGKFCGAGLPTYIQSLFNIPLITVDKKCLKDSTNFYLGSNNLDSIKWDFGDLSTGNANYSKLKSPSHLYSDTGLFKVKTIVYLGLLKDTVTTLVQIYDPFFNLGKDTALCLGDMTILKVNKPGYQIKWQDNSSSFFYNVNLAGIYWAETSLGGCIYRDSITIRIITLPKLDLGKDSTVCENSKVFLNADIGNAYYRWQDGNKGKSYWVKQAGLYHVTINYQGCLIQDSITIRHKGIPRINLGKDTQICEGNYLLLKAYFSINSQYLWQDQSKGNTYKAQKTGLYWLQIDSNGCKNIDSLNLVVSPQPNLNLGGNQTYCKGDSIYIDLGSAADTYLWKNGSTQSHVILKDSGILYVSGKKGQCSSSDTALIEFINCNCFVFIPNAFTPQEDRLNDGFLPVINCPNTAYYLVVLNRWGEIVFESRDPHQAWNGQINGINATQDVYAWTLQFHQFSDHTFKTYRGTLQLLR